MTHIITTTDVQQKIGQITASITENAYIVTNRGRGKIVMLPYYAGCDSWIEDYLEDYEMWLNREKLEKKLAASHRSGKSGLVI